MDHGCWSQLEALFDQLSIRPLVAVVPDNLDPVLQVDAPDPAFWDRVRAWRDKGWTIAMHGYQHHFHFVDREKLLLPFYDRSEFAGLSLEEQSVKIRASWKIFQHQDIQPKVWIAPAHCFDQITLQALRNESPIRIISDGIARNDFYENGFFWIPQQLWSLAPRNSGLWTLCLHPNSMSLADIERLGEVLSTPYYQKRIVSFKDVKLSRQSRSALDHLYAWAFWSRIRIVSALLTLRHNFLARNK